MGKRRGSTKKTHVGNQLVGARKEKRKTETQKKKRETRQAAGRGKKSGATRGQTESGLEKPRLSLACWEQEK